MNRDRVYLLLLSGKFEDANKFVTVRYPGCECVALLLRELREGGWRGLKGLRVVKVSCRAQVELQLACISAKSSTAYGLAHDTVAIVVSGNFQASVELFWQISWAG